MLPRHWQNPKPRYTLARSVGKHWREGDVFRINAIQKGFAQRSAQILLLEVLKPVFSDLEL